MVRLMSCARICQTYHTGPVTAAEVAVAVGGLAAAVGAALITAEAGAAGVTGLDSFSRGNSRGVDGNGRDEGADDSGELHFERWRVVC
jgi:hypothetical protein